MIDKASLKMILMAVILIFLLLTLFFAYSSYQFQNNSIVVEGIATKISYSRNSGAAKNAQGNVSFNERDQSNQSMLVKYTTLDGQKLETFFPMLSNMLIGEPINVRYSIRNPTKALPDRPIQTWIRPLLLGFISFFLIIAYMAFL